MLIINEQTTLVMQLAFTDEKAEPVIPSAAQYRLDNMATYDLIITDAQNATLNAAREVEKKRLTVKITFGLDNKKATGEYIYAVRNLSKTI
jgi:ribulose 1,5-bisphosphate synthetase/thiazole synthase